MGIFSSILSKLGFGDKKEAATPPTPPVAPTAPAAPVAVPVEATTPVSTPVPLPTPAISEVDVVAQLTAMAAASREKLNWKVSIVDLLKLLGLDSSFAARKELAVELGCPAEKMADSAQMNMWLHKTVLRKLADNGGNIPADLLD